MCGISESLDPKAPIGYGFTIQATAGLGGLPEKIGDNIIVEDPMSLIANMDNDNAQNFLPMPGAPYGDEGASEATTTCNRTAVAIRFNFTPKETTSSSLSTPQG